MLTETAARWMLVLHTALGVSAVGAATHLVIWLRDYRRGNFARHRAVRRFAWLAFGLHAAGFLAGNAMYPTYRVEVRAAYLDNGNAIAHDAETRAAVIAGVEARDHGATAATATPPIAAGEAVRRAAAAARWFDVKEHWIALGLIVSAALVLLLSLWDPRRDSAAIVPVVFGMSIVVAGTLWLAAIIGVMTASFRAV